MSSIENIIDITDNIFITNNNKLNNRNNTIKLLKNKVEKYSSEIKKINKSSIENMMNTMIIKDYDYNNCETSVLFSLFIYLTKLTKNEDIILNVCELYKTHKKVITSLDNYLNMIYNITERNIIYSILLNFDILPYIHKYYNTSIKHTILIPTNNVLTNPKYFLNEQATQYNDTVCAFKLKLNEMTNILSQHQFESNIKAAQIISALSCKINNTYSCFYKFNKPELVIYNKLIDIKLIKPSILYVFNHFTLPITRNGTHHLYADFFIVFNINEHFQFAIIEYDGPTHYNIKDDRITKNKVYCDIVKNNFCIKNSIHILRINDYDKDYLTKIYNFIDDIIKDNGIISIIPPFEFYSTLLENIIN
jgi:hypothetical protein